MFTLLTDTPAEPVLVIWMSCCPLVVPTVTEAKEALLGATETDAGEAAAVPDRVTGYTFPAALMFSVPLALPATTGAKTTKMSHFVPGAMTPFHVPVARQ